MPENKTDNKGFHRPWMENKESILEKQNKAIQNMKELGRWPANFIHDGSEEVVSLFPNTKSSNGSFKASDYEEKETSTPFTRGDFEGYGDEGSAARFFYCPKANKKDRNEGCEELEEKQTIGGGGTNDPNGDDVCGKYGSVKAKANNNHPTVKPTELMRYLCRLITPKNGTVLDPFMGSGSTGKAAVLEGFSFIGIELSQEYLNIAEKRINLAITVNE
jgi:site-specific DNA-methyltransferase (adenine-specific)